MRVVGYSAAGISGICLRNPPTKKTKTKRPLRKGVFLFFKKYLKQNQVFLGFLRFFFVFGFLWRSLGTPGSCPIQNIPQQVSKAQVGPRRKKITHQKFPPKRTGIPKTAFKINKPPNLVLDLLTPTPVSRELSKAPASYLALSPGISKLPLDPPPDSSGDRESDWKAWRLFSGGPYRLFALIV